jgi:hypothetical protein
MRQKRHPARRLVTSVLVAPLLFVILYYGWLGISAWRAGYTWDEMDWNGDGRTDIREFFQTNGVGRRPVLSNGRTCVEYFRLEDQRPLRITCEAGE